MTDAIDLPNTFFFKEASCVSQGVSFCRYFLPKGSPATRKEGLQKTLSVIYKLQS